MVDLDTIRSLVKFRMRRILEFGEAALPPGQFAAFRKLVLDEFGRSGLETELERVFREKHHEHVGMGRPTLQGKEVDHA
jgi:hypothetical protein